MNNALPARVLLANRGFLLDIIERRLLRKQNERPAPEAALQQWAKALASLETE